MDLLDQQISVQVFQGEGEYSIVHLADQQLLQLPVNLALTENEQSVLSLPGRGKEGKTLDVIPVRVAEEQDRAKAAWAAVGQVLTQQPDPCPGIEDQNLMICRLDLYTRGVAPNPDGIWTWHGNRTTNTPEPDFHPKSNSLPLAPMDYTPGASGGQAPLQREPPDKKAKRTAGE
jgi:hypothetical protein